MAGVAQDATSGKFLPATLAQWTATLAVAGISSGGPSALHLLQEASGNPADAIGSFPLTAAGTLAYQQSVSGWSTKGIATSLGVAGTLQSTAAGLPSINSASMLAIVYVLLPASVATLRSVYQFGPGFGSQAAAWLVSSKSMKCQLDPNGVAGVTDATSIVRPVVLKIDRTNGVGALYTDLERLAPTLTSTPTGKAYTLGGDNFGSNFPDNETYLYSAVFFNAAAEMTDTAVRSLLRTLGWSPLW